MKAWLLILLLFVVGCEPPLRPNKKLDYCPDCGKVISKNAVQCPYCGSDEMRRVDRVKRP